VPAVLPELVELVELVVLLVLQARLQSEQLFLQVVLLAVMMVR